MKQNMTASIRTQKQNQLLIKMILMMSLSQSIV